MKIFFSRIDSETLEQRERKWKKKEPWRLYIPVILTLTVFVYVLFERISYPFSILSQWSFCCLCDSSQELLNLQTVSLSLFLSEMPPPSSHGRLHPDVLSRTHADSEGWWNPTEVSFNSFFYSSALGQNLLSCAPLFLFIQEVSQTEANHSTSLPLSDPAYFYSLCICFEITPHTSEFPFFIIWALKRRMLWFHWKDVVVFLYLYHISFSERMWFSGERTFLINRNSPTTESCFIKQD